MSSESKNDRTREAKSAARAKAAAMLEQQRRRERRKSLLTWVAVGVGVVLVGGVITGVVVANSNTTGKAAAAVPSSAPTTASGVDSAPPWNAPADPSARAKAAGLTMLSAEGTVEHIHSHLTVAVDGKAVTVPALLGIDEANASISPLHTHDTSGIVHIESPVKATFTLGQVFTEWDVALAAGKIGSYSAASGDTVTTFVDGKPVTGDPAAITLANHEDIDIVVTKAGETATAPAAFTWPAGY
ncbi:hypothetical protein ACPPVQ_02750 [Diaminobutyricibacter sp. McL0618]|uniref:hypothetical protein n=1 Tax=Leifsonia sp. McL0618 TaxID=3415677 RepID=UPI003CF5813A